MAPVFAKRLFGNKQAYEEWIEESVEFFRQLGFFESQRNMATATLIAKLEKLQQESNGERFRPGEKTSDLHLIVWDSKRVWFSDDDALVLPGNEAYVQAVQELCGISRKQLRIAQIEELWAGEEGPITVRFLHKRKKYEISPRYLETYFDYGILRYLNKYLEHAKFRFEVCHDVGENPVVLVLHEEEKELLQIKRGWKFVDTYSV